MDELFQLQTSTKDAPKDKLLKWLPRCDSGWHFWRPKGSYSETYFGDHDEHYLTTKGSNFSEYMGGPFYKALEN